MLKTKFLSTQLNLIYNFCFNNKKYSLLSLDNNLKKIFLDIAYDTLDKINYDQNKPQYNTCISIISTLENGYNVISKYKFISPLSNTCYMDSLLFALLSPQINYINTYILRGKTIPTFCENAKIIQTELRELKYYLYNINKQSTYTCKNLKTFFGKCKILSTFSSLNINDPTEFLSKLFEIFYTNNLTTETNFYVSNDITIQKKWKITSNKLLNDKESVIRNIDLMSIDKPRNNLLFIQDFINYTEIIELDNDNLYRNEDDNIKYKFYKKQLKIISSDILIFSIFRKLTDDINQSDFTDYPIYPNEILIVSNNNKIFKYNLCSCVIYTGYLHYKCYFKNGNMWYIYNDLDPEIKLIGSFNDMIKLDVSPITHATILIYDIIT